MIEIAVFGIHDDWDRIETVAGTGSRYICCGKAV